MTEPRRPAGKAGMKKAAGVPEKALRPVAKRPPAPAVDGGSGHVAGVPAALSAIELASAPSLPEMIEAAVTPAAGPCPAADDAPAPVIGEQAVATPAPVPAAGPDEPAIAAPADDIVDVDAAEPAGVRPPDPVAALPPAPAFTRGLFDMATTFDAAAVNPAVATEKVKAMFGGLNDRAKTAMEKLPKIGEELSELTKGNVEALVESGKVVAKGAESLTQEAVEFGKKNFESATALFKSMAAAKSPTELFQLQSDYAKSSFDTLVAETSKLSEAWVKLAGEAVQPLQNRYALAAEKMKTATAA